MSQPRSLSAKEIESYAQEIVNGSEPVELSPEELTDSSRIALEKRISELSKLPKATEDIEEDEPVQLPDEDALSGGVEVPGGYHLVLVISGTHDQDNSEIQLSDLKPNCHIDKIDNVSLVMNRSVDDPKRGTLSGRIIADMGGQAYVFRKDEKGTSNFKVSFSHQHLPVS